MKKYEYKFVSKRATDYLTDFTTIINSLSKEGWKIIDRYSDSGLMIFILEREFV